jgi:hypothetical protein
MQVAFYDGGADAPFTVNPFRMNPSGGLREMRIRRSGVRVHHDFVPRRRIHLGIQSIWIALLFASLTKERFECNQSVAEL